VLFDSGSDRTFINRKALPKGAVGKTVHSIPFDTLNGTRPRVRSLIDFMADWFEKPENARCL